MGEILNTCVIGKPVSDEFDTLLPDKIEVVDCESYPDCSYIETVRFTFSVCNQKGATPGFHGPKQIVYLKIVAGYIPVERVKAELRRLLSRFNIFRVEELIEAFAYRRYYCRY